MQVELIKKPSSFVDKDGVKVDFDAFYIVVDGQYLKIAFKNKALAKYLLKDLK